MTESVSASDLSILLTGAIQAGMVMAGQAGADTALASWMRQVCALHGIEASDAATLSMKGCKTPDQATAALLGWIGGQRCLQ